MLPPSFASLQSKLLAYIIAACILSATWPAQRSRTLVHATELPVVPEAQDRDGSYAPDFGAFDRGILGRQEATLNDLKNNERKEMDISPGTTRHFVLRRGRSRTPRADDDTPEALDARGIDNASEEAQVEIMPTEKGVIIEDSAELATRQAGNRVWISANTCRQPSANSNSTQTPKTTPQLVMYVSTQNQKPGPDSLNNLATDPTGVLFDSGVANFNLQTDSDVYVGISAPNLDEKWFGSWRFEVAASTDGPYHSYNDTNPFLFMVDTDSESALFLTYSLSESDAPEEINKWKENNPFRMYAFPAGAGSPIMGVEHSYCAIKELFSSTNNLTVATSITTKFGSGYPKSQFHMQGLENGKKYNGFLVVEGNQSETVRLPGVGQVRGGGKVFQQFEWTTKADDSCQVLFDLEFCDSVAYAVPSSPEFKFDDDALKKIYDDQAKSYYTNFSRSLAQVACDTVSEAQYSLARTCKDCERDYKNWLCSVLIPRCEDWSKQDEWLQERNVNAAFANGSFLNLNETQRDRFGFKQSRNPLIDEVIKPGPYKEMKPCEDLCFDIVRSCPATMEFSCPNPGTPARLQSYGQRDPQQDELWCNFPGAVVKLNVQGVAGTLAACERTAVLVALSVIALLWL